MLVPVFICTYFVFIVIVNASVYFYVMFIFPSDQFLLKVQTEVFCVNDLFSVGITPMFSPPEGDTSMFRCFATIAIPFYLSLMTLSCSKRVFLPMGLCIFFSVTVWTSLSMHTFTFTIQTHTFKATSSLIQITFESQMWTVLLVSYHTCVCVCVSISVWVSAKASLSQRIWCLGWGYWPSTAMTSIHLCLKYSIDVIYLFNALVQIIPCWTINFH